METNDSNSAISDNPTKKPIIISLYATKGGVGKTTLTTAFGYLLAEQNKRVLIYDCDVQRNLTSWLFYKRIQDEFGGDVNAFVSSDRKSENDQFTLYDQFTADNLQSAVIKEVNPNLYFVPGDRNVNALSRKITIIEDACISKHNTVNDSSGKPYHAIMKTAQEHNFDYVLLDLNTYPSELNRCLVMTSDYLVIPTFDDCHCAETFENMKEIILEWYHDMEQVKMQTLESIFPLPEINVKFIGSIIINRPIPIDEQDNAIIHGVAQEKYEDNCIQRICGFANDITMLANTRHIAPLTISTEVYNAVNRSCILGCIREFESLKDISDSLKIPVPLLDTIYRENTETCIRSQEFKKTFEAILETITVIIREDQSRSNHSR